MVDPAADRKTNLQGACTELRDIVGRAIDGTEPSPADATRAVTLGFLLLEFLMWDIYRIAEAQTAANKSRLSDT
jgi:hypothetical protein